MPFNLDVAYCIVEKYSLATIFLCLSFSCHLFSISISRYHKGYTYTAIQLYVFLHWHHVQQCMWHVSQSLANLYQNNIVFIVESIESIHRAWSLVCLDILLNICCLHFFFSQLQSWLLCAHQSQSNNTSPRYFIDTDDTTDTYHHLILQRHHDTPVVAIDDWCSLRQLVVCTYIVFRGWDGSAITIVYWWSDVYGTIWCCQWHAHST